MTSCCFTAVSSLDMVLDPRLPVLRHRPCVCVATLQVGGGGQSGGGGGGWELMGGRGSIAQPLHLLPWVGTQ